MGSSRRLTRTPALLLTILTLTLLAPAHSRAQSEEQQPKPTQSKGSEPQSKESRPKEPRAKEARTNESQPKVFCDASRAVSLVETQLSEMKMLEDAPRRMSVMTRAADLLWPYERDTAREIFRQAYDLAAKDFREHGDDIVKTDISFAYTSRPDQRFIVMNAIARRDPAWAKQLAEAVAAEKRRESEQSPDATNKQSWKPGVAEETLGVAESLIKVDLNTSLEMARGTLRAPASYTLVFYLLKLAGTNQNAGDAFYAEALDAYKNGTASDLAYLAVYPFALNREPATVPVGLYYSPPKGFAPGARLREAFVVALFNQIEKVFRTPEVAPEVEAQMTTEQGQWLTMLTMLEPHIARVSPALLERALALKGMAQAAASAQSRTRAEEFARTQREYDDEGAFGRTLERMDGERDPAKRDFLIANLITSARGVEEFARAESFLDKVGDAPLRDKLASYLYFRWTQKSVKDGQLDEASRLSKKVPELDYRALLSFEIAGAALKKLDDRARAAELLDALAAEAQKAPDTPAKARALLGAAHLYADFDATRATQLLRAAVKVVNTLPDPDFGSETIGREIGNKVFTMYAIYNVPGMRLENAFRELGALDFESALSAANDITDKYQRALAVLGLASKCLEDPARKPTRR
jgi:hypothetical protein